MQEITYFCDLCGKASRKGIFVQKCKEVIFTTDQNEGRATPPHFEYVRLEWCLECRDRGVQGEAVFAEGMHGHNRYYFKNPPQPPTSQEKEQEGL